MTSNRILTKLAVSLLAAAIFPATASAAEYQQQGGCGEFTVAMIPDTQNYVDYRHQKWSGFPFDATEQFYEQMQWVAENAQSSGGEIAFATHVGDIWQHYSAWVDPAHAASDFPWMPNGGSEVARSPKVHTKSYEIPVSIQAFQLIAGKLPFSVVPGNHDFDALWTDPAHPPQPEKGKAGARYVGGLTGFSSAFSAESQFFSGQAWYVDSHDGGGDSAQVFAVGQCRFLHIGLQYYAPDASLAWATEVIRRYPGLPTIVSTHAYLDRDGTRIAKSSTVNSAPDSSANSPQMIWDEFISQHDQIFLVLSGHVSGQGFSVDTNHFGNDVYQILADYQGRAQTAKDAGEGNIPIGDGWLRLLKFRLDADMPIMEVRTYSPHYGKFASEIPEYAARYKASDGQAHLSDQNYLERDTFTVELDDFHRRFRGYTNTQAE